MQCELEFSKQVDKLLQVWELLVSYLNASGEVSTELINFIEKRTLEVVLRAEWVKAASAARTHLQELSTRALAIVSPAKERGGGAKGKWSPEEEVTCSNETAPVTNYRFERFQAPDADVITTKESARVTLAALNDAIADPWPPIVMDIVNGEQKTPNNAVLSFYYKEFGTMLKARIDHLIAVRCDDVALPLVEVFIKCLDDASWNLGKRKWKVAHHFLDVYIALLFKLNRHNCINSLLHELSPDEGLSLIRRYLTKGTPKRLWKRSLKIAEHAASMFTTIAILNPEKIDLPDFMDQMVTLWMKIFERDKEVFSRFPDTIRRIIAHTKTPENMYELSKSLMRQVGIVIRPFCIELTIRALALHVNVLLSVQQFHDETAPRVHDSNHPLCHFEDTKTIKMLAAPRLEELAQLLHPAPTARRECLLSAFCMYPTSRRLASLLAEACDGDVCGDRRSELKTRGIPEAARDRTEVARSGEGRSRSSMEKKGAHSSEEIMDMFESLSFGGDEETHEDREKTSTASSTKDEEKQKKKRGGKESSGLEGKRESHKEGEAVFEGVPGDRVKDPSGLREAAALLGIPDKLCDDLLVIISCNRVRTLSWALPWEELQARCITYMREEYNARSACHKLHYLSPDFSSYSLRPNATSGKETVQNLKKGVSEDGVTVLGNSISTEEKTVNVFEEVITTEEEKRSRSLRAKRTSTYFEQVDESLSDEENLTATQNQKTEKVTKPISQVEVVPCHLRDAEDVKRREETLPMMPSGQESSPIEDSFLGIPDLMTLPSHPNHFESEKSPTKNHSKRSGKTLDSRKEGEPSVQSEQDFLPGEVLENGTDVSSECDSQATASGDEMQWDDMSEVALASKRETSTEPNTGDTSINVPLHESTCTVDITPTGMKLPVPNPAPKVKGTQIKILSSSGHTDYVTLYCNDNNNPLYHTSNASAEGSFIKALASTPVHGSNTSGNKRDSISLPGPSVVTQASPMVQRQKEIQSTPIILQNLPKCSLQEKLLSTVNTSHTSTIGKKILLSKEVRSILNENRLLLLDPTDDWMTQNRERETKECGMERDVKFSKTPSTHSYQVPPIMCSNSTRTIAGTTVNNSLSQATNNVNAAIPVSGYGPANTSRNLIPNPALVPNAHVNSWVNPRDPRLLSRCKTPFKKGQEISDRSLSHCGQSTMVHQLKSPLRTQDVHSLSVGSQGSGKPSTEVSGTKTLEEKVNLLGNENMDKRCVRLDCKKGNYSICEAQGSQPKNSVSLADRGSHVNVPFKCSRMFDSPSPMDSSSKLPPQQTLAADTCKKIQKYVVKGPMFGSAVPPSQMQTARGFSKNLLKQNFPATDQRSGVSEKGIPMLKHPLNIPKIPYKQRIPGGGTEVPQIVSQRSRCEEVRADWQSKDVTAKTTSRRGRKPTKGKAAVETGTKTCIIQKPKCPTFVDKQLQYPSPVQSGMSIALPNLMTMDKSLKTKGKCPNVTDSLRVAVPQKKTVMKIQNPAIGMADPLKALFAQCEAGNFPSGLSPLFVPLPRSRKQNEVVRSDIPHYLQPPGRKCTALDESIPVSSTNTSIVGEDRSRELGSRLLRGTLYRTELEVTKCEKIIAVRKRKCDSVKGTTETSTRGRKRVKKDEDSEEWTPNKQHASKGSRKKPAKEQSTGPESSGTVPKKKRGRKPRIPEASKQVEVVEKSPRKASAGRPPTVLCSHIKRLRSPECATRNIRTSTRGKMEAPAQ